MQKNASGAKPQGLTGLTTLRSVARVSSLLLCMALFFVWGCPKQPLEDTARDTAAASGAFISTAQAAHQSECAANPQKNVCAVIDRAIGAQNLLISATESYCGWPARPTAAELAANTGPCQRIKTAQAALTTALRNMNTVASDLKTVTGKAGN